MDIVDEAKALSLEALRREAVKALQDEKKQQLQRSHSRLDEAALAREHLSRLCGRRASLSSFSVRWAKKAARDRRPS